MFNDIITNLNIPDLFIFLNGKYEKFYEIVFQSMLNIITQKGEYELKARIKVTDSEIDLRKSLKKKKLFQMLCILLAISTILRIF